MAHEDERSLGQKLESRPLPVELEELWHAYKRAGEASIPESPESPILRGLIYYEESLGGVDKDKEQAEELRAQLRHLERHLVLSDYLKKTQAHKHYELFSPTLTRMKDKVLRRVKNGNITPFDVFLLAFLIVEIDNKIEIDDENSERRKLGHAFPPFKAVGLPTATDKFREEILEPAGRLEQVIDYVNKNQGAPVLIRSYNGWAAGQVGSLRFRLKRPDEAGVGPDHVSNYVRLFFHPLGETKFTEFMPEKCPTSSKTSSTEVEHNANGLIGEETVKKSRDHLDFAVGEHAVQQLISDMVSHSRLNNYYYNKMLFGIFGAINGANILPSLDWEKLLGKDRLRQFRDEFEGLKEVDFDPFRYRQKV